MTIKIKSTDMFGTVELDKLIESKNNIRGARDDQSFKDLVSSIKEKGILVPLTVRNFKSKFQILAGSRRYRAAKQLKLTEMPVQVKDVSDEEAYEIMLIENLQRENIHPMDEAKGFLNLCGYLSKEEKNPYAIIASKTGKTENYIARNIKLADLIDKAQKLFCDNVITVQHALLICRLTEKDQGKILAEKIRTYPKIHAAPVIDWKGWIESSTTRLLSKACFDGNDPDLFPEAGACATCPKNTEANVLMFDDMDGNAKCTDRDCFAAKSRKYLSAERKKLKEKETDFLEGALIEGWYGSSEKIKIQGQEYDYKKKSELKKPLLVLIRSHNLSHSDKKSRVGKTVWIEDPRKKTKSGAITEKPELKKSKSSGETWEEREVRELKERRKRHFMEAQLVFVGVKSFPKRQSTEEQTRCMIDGILSMIEGRTTAMIAYGLGCDSMKNCKDPIEAYNWIADVTSEESQKMEDEIATIVMQEFDFASFYILCNGLTQVFQYTERKGSEWNDLLELAKLDEKKLIKAFKKDMNAFVKSRELADEKEKEQDSK